MWPSVYHKNILDKVGNLKAHHQQKITIKVSRKINASRKKHIDSNPFKLFKYVVRRGGVNYRGEIGSEFKRVCASPYPCLFRPCLSSFASLVLFHQPRSLFPVLFPFPIILLLSSFSFPILLFFPVAFSFPVSSFSLFLSLFSVFFSFPSLLSQPRSFSAILFSFITLSCSVSFNRASDVAHKSCKDRGIQDRRTMDFCSLEQDSIDTSLSFQTGFPLEKIHFRGDTFQMRYPLDELPSDEYRHVPG